jgi:hypothetical protein
MAVPGREKRAIGNGGVDIVNLTRTRPDEFGRLGGFPRIPMQIWISGNESELMALKADCLKNGVKLP